MRRIRFRPRLRAVQGFTLLEVLVSILVLSLGVLGAVGLQAMALQSNSDARMQSSAVRYARELGELMRGNPAVARQAGAGANPYLFDSTGGAPASAADCRAAACATGSDIAGFQVADWWRRVDGELPGARASVCFDATPYDAQGLPRWACSGGGGVAVVKIGWVRHTTDGGSPAAAASAAAGLDMATRPSVVLPVIAGN